MPVWRVKHPKVWEQLWWWVEVVGVLKHITEVHDTVNKWSFERNSGSGRKEEFREKLFVFIENICNAGQNAWGPTDGKAV